MKVLYITSGFNGGYPHQFIDQFIKTSFNSVSHQMRHFDLVPNLGWHRKLYQVIDSFNPDYVFTIHGGYMTESIVQRIKESGCKVGIWFVDDPYDIDASKQKLFSYDYIFTNEKECIPVYNRHGFPRVFHLPLGVQTAFYRPQRIEGQYYSDLCFVGTPFPERINILKYLVAKLPRLSYTIIGPQWSSYLSGRARVINHPLGPGEVSKYYNGARINLNIHRNEVEQFNPALVLNQERIRASSPNNRTFDIAACRSFQIVDNRRGLEEYYDLKKELVTFDDKTDLAKKVEYYLNSSEERSLIANRAYRRTLQHYTFEQVLNRMLSTVENNLLDEIRVAIRCLNGRGEMGGKLVKGAGPAVYFLHHGRKYSFPNEETFLQLGCHWEHINIMSEHELNSIPSGMQIRL